MTKFKVIGTETVLEPSVKEVEEMYLADPKTYKPLGGDSGAGGKSEYELLKEEAAALGLKFKSNISKADLITLIEQEKAKGGDSGAGGSE